MSAASSTKPGDIDGIMQKMHDAALKGVKAAALLIENAAKTNCPVRTGTLRRSIQTEVEDQTTKIIATIGPQVDYAPYVEFGTSRMAARPYMRPAFESEKEAAMDAIKQELRSAL